MRSIRKRILLVLVLILSQVAALAVLAGALWFVKVKETMLGRVVFSRSDGRTIADIALSNQDLIKVKNGSIIFGGASAGSFKARVLRRHRDAHGARLCAIVLQRNPGGMTFSKDAQPMDVLMWTRTRRALAIFLDRSTLSQGQTENLKYQPH